jgi:hypothetical protein
MINSYKFITRKNIFTLFTGAGLLLLGFAFPVQIKAQPFVPTASPTNWTNSTMTSGFLVNSTLTKKVFVHDPNNTNDNQFTGGSADPDAISTWAWSNGNTNNKGDITNSGVVYLASTNQVAFFGDRTAINGDAQIGFWFFLGNVAPISGGTFTGTHQEGDILVLSNFTNGGGAVNLRIYMWQSGVLNFIGDTKDFPQYGSAAVNSSYVMIANAGPFGQVYQNNTNTWTYQGQNVPSVGTPDANQYATGSFFEGVINLTSIPGASSCIQSYLLETRNSQSVTASLQDFVASGFNAVPAPPTVTGDTQCYGHVATATATCTSGVTKWYSGTTLVQTGGTTYTYPANTAVGTYTLTVYCVDGNCTSAPSTVTVVINPLPACSITGTNIICAGTTTSFSGPAGMSSYAWTGPSGFTASTQSTGNISVAGTYTLTITNSYGCTSTCSQYLTVNPLPTVSVNSPSVCPASLPVTISATVSPTATYGYSWIVPVGATNPGNVSSFSANIAGTYTVTVTNQTTGCSKTAAGILTVYGTPTVAATASPTTIDLLSPSHTSTLSALGSVNGVQNNALFSSFTWAPYPESGFDTAPVSSLSSTSGASVIFTAPNNSVTSYKFMVTATTTNGCTATATVSVGTAGSFSCPLITPPGVLCVGTAGTFTATGTIPQYLHFDWSATGATISGTTHDVTMVSVTPTAAGTYTVTLSVSFESTLFSPLTCVATGVATDCNAKGCTLGYYKNHTTVWDQLSDPIVSAMPAGMKFTTSTYFKTYFPGAYTFTGLTNTTTMLQVLNLNGGGCVAMARNSIAALLSKAAFGNDYAFPGSFMDIYSTILTTLNGNYFTYDCSTLNDALNTANNNEASGACSALGNMVTMRNITNPDEVITKLSVVAFPNPFNATVKFIISSPGSGHVQLDVLNILGQKIATAYDGNIQANSAQQVEFTVPASAPQNLMYILKMGDQQVTGKLMRINR